MTPLVFELVLERAPQITGGVFVPVRMCCDFYHCAHVTDLPDTNSGLAVPE